MFRYRVTLDIGTSYWDHTNDSFRYRETPDIGTSKISRYWVLVRSTRYPENPDIRCPDIGKIPDIGTVKNPDAALAAAGEWVACQSHSGS
jgi:hypothetical protein